LHIFYGIIHGAAEDNEWCEENTFLQFKFILFALLAQTVTMIKKKRWRRLNKTLCRR
jgi:hypothetical protein